jgi:TolB protein
MRSDGSGQVDLTNHPGNEWGPAWSPDGEQIVFSSDREGGFPKLFVMNQDGTGLRQLTEGWGEYPSWSTDGERIAFECLQGAGSPTSRPDYDICVVDAGGSGEAILVAHPANDGAPAWSPDGGTIAFQSERDACPDGKVVTSVEACEDGSVIYLVDADGSNPHRITEPSPPGGWETPDWSPAGDALVVAKSGKVVIVRPDGELLADLGPGNFPDWAAGS